MMDFYDGTFMVERGNKRPANVRKRPANARKRPANARQMPANAQQTPGKHPLPNKRPP